MGTLFLTMHILLELSILSKYYEYNLYLDIYKLLQPKHTFKLQSRDLHMTPYCAQKMF